VKAKPGYIIDDQGVERKVLGTLQLTGDGCVIGAYANVYVWWEPQYSDGEGVVVFRETGGGVCAPLSCYSTREACAAARVKQ
jgi:hypothetical protein